MNYNLPSYSRSISWRKLGLLELRSIRWQERNQRFDGSAGLGEMGRAHDTTDTDVEGKVWSLVKLLDLVPMTV